MKTHWTKDEDDQLKALRLSGHSFSQIGKHLGKTRNACCSRADRIGMEVRSPARKTPPKIVASVVIDTPPAPRGRKLVSLMDLTSTTCRWPFGDPKDKAFGFCGCACDEGKPYCAEHEGKAYSHIRTEKEKRREANKAPVADKVFDRWAA